MGSITNLFKEKMASEFSKEDAFTSEVGNEVYRGFKSEIPENKKKGGKESEFSEEWSEKYKKSIDCSNPKGFSQKAHCQGRKKKEAKEATGAGGAGQYSGPLFSGEEPKKVEATEATGSGSSGSYVTPAAWAKTTSKKDWRGKSKTQIPGGKFVTIKKKCKKFPYCNQGDIKALKLYENKIVKSVISKISKEHNISENVIKSIIQYEIEKQMNK
jgi:hypothetical protein